MGCTNSKATTTTPLITDDDFLIPDSFRSVVQTDRKRIDEHFLQEILQRHPDDQQTRENSSIIARKIIDLLLERNDIQTTKKLSKSLEDQLTSIPHQQIEQTIDLFKQIINKGSYHHSPTNNGKINKDSEKIVEQILPGEPGIPLKEALEKARILFYKGKQAAIFANPHGGYDVRIVDEPTTNDGNLLRSIIVSEVKLRPQSSAQSTLLEPSDHINEEFRRSIDAALKTFESISPTDPQHPMTYTEMIQSQSRDGEESRRMLSQTFDEVPPSPTSFQVITKSEFSNDPTSGEKIMEQSVQIISVKVRNETKTSNEGK